MAALAPGFVQRVRSILLVRQIGVRYAEPREDDALELFHCGGGGLGVVIVAKQMKKSMNREMGEMMVERFVFFGRFARGRLVGDGDIAERFHRAEFPREARCRWK